MTENNLASIRNDLARITERLGILRDQMLDFEYLFCETYLKTWNGKRSAEMAGLAGDEHQLSIQAWQQLGKPRVQEYIHLRVLEAQMGADEVLYRLALQARGTLEDFYDIDASGQPTLDLTRAKKYGLLSIVKELIPTSNGWRVVLYDSQSALAQLGKFHALWTERIIERDTDEGDVESLEKRADRVATLLDSARARRDAEVSHSEPALDA